MNIRLALKAISILTLVMSGPVCAEVSRKLVPRSDHEFTVSTGVIFSESVSKNNKLCSGPADCWVPAPADVVSLEKGFSRYLRASTEYGANEITKNLTSYKRKYFGYKKNGERQIAVAGYCSQLWRPESPTFQSLSQSARDLGRCFYLVEYNVDKGKFSDLYIDGEG